MGIYHLLCNSLPWLSLDPLLYCSLLGGILTVGAFFSFGGWDWLLACLFILAGIEGGVQGIGILTPGKINTELQLFIFLGALVLTWAVLGMCFSRFPKLPDMFLGAWLKTAAPPCLGAMLWYYACFSLGGLGKPLSVVFAGINFIVGCAMSISGDTEEETESVD